MKLTIGVMGSSGGPLDEVARVKAGRLGEAIATRDASLITGGCPGLPYEAVRGAKGKGAWWLASRRGCRSMSTGASMPRRPRGSMC